MDSAWLDDYGSAIGAVGGRATDRFWRHLRLRRAALLFDLKAIAVEGGTLADVIHHLDAIRDRHASKERFPERLKGLGER